MFLGDELGRVVDAIIAGEVHPIPQEQLLTAGEEPTPPPKIFKDTCKIQWNQPCKKVYDFIRGLSPIPTAWTNSVASNGQEFTFNIYQAAKTDDPCQDPPGTVRAERKRLYVATADYWLEILHLQMAGKKRMAARDFLNGFNHFNS